MRNDVQKLVVQTSNHVPCYVQVLVHVFVGFLTSFELDGELAYLLCPVFAALLQLN